LLCDEDVGGDNAASVAKADFPDDDVGGDFEEDVSAFINISRS
jgi:hypothetical protein